MEIDAYDEETSLPEWSECSEPKNELLEWSECFEPKNEVCKDFIADYNALDTISKKKGNELCKCAYDGDVDEMGKYCDSSFGQKCVEFCAKNGEQSCDSISTYEYSDFDENSAIQEVCHLKCNDECRNNKRYGDKISEACNEYCKPPMNLKPIYFHGTSIEHGNKIIDDGRLKGSTVHSYTGTDYGIYLTPSFTYATHYIKKDDGMIFAVSDQVLQKKKSSIRVDDEFIGRDVIGYQNYFHSNIIDRIINAYPENDALITEATLSQEDIDAAKTIGNGNIEAFGVIGEYVNWHQNESNEYEQETRKAISKGMPIMIDDEQTQEGIAVCRAWKFQNEHDFSLRKENEIPIPTAHDNPDCTTLLNMSIDTIHDSLIQTAEFEKQYSI